MERQKREASQKVKNYRSFHLSGDLSEQVAGQVAQGILHFDSPQHTCRTPLGGENRISEPKQVCTSGVTQEPTHSLQNTLGFLGDNTSISTAPYQNTHTHAHSATQAHASLNTGTIPLALVTRQPQDIQSQDSEVLRQAISHNNIRENPPSIYVDSTPSGDTRRESTTNRGQSGARCIVTGYSGVLGTHDIRGNCTTISAERTSTQLSAKTTLFVETTQSTNMSEELRTKLEKQKAATLSLQEQVSQTEITNELSNQKRQQEAWQAALSRFKQIEEEQQKAHAEKLVSIQAMTGPSSEGNSMQLEWLQKKIAELQPGHDPLEEERRKQEEKRKQEEAARTKTALEELLQQQRDISEKAAQIASSTSSTVTPEIQALIRALQPQHITAPENPPQNPDQQTLLEQLKLTLRSKNPAASGDWQKDMLRQFLTNSNKTTTSSGVTTLKPELLKRLANEQEEFSMADWLAMLNREEAGEWECDNNDECKHKNVRSGILDKATTNIVHKEVWPQKNLLEDWADEDMEFKNLLLEHHIAGEVRTIETCTEPAQILGRLRLLRRMAYAKLRGYEWPVIRKMYAAILRSIEAKEHTWSDNFDRFETILYRRTQTQQHRPYSRNEREQQKKWFCRDYNKPEGCNKQSPHKAWFGSGTNAVTKTVVHICATCYMKEKAAREHPETHEGCPHKSA